MNKQMKQTVEQRYKREKSLLLDAIDAYKRKIPDSRAKSREQLINGAKARLSAICIVLGELDEAKKYTEELQYQKGIREVDVIRTAIEADDNAACDCKDDTVFDQSGSHSVSRFVKWKTIKHPSGEKYVDVYRCTKCGFSNAVNGYLNKKGL